VVVRAESNGNGEKAAAVVAAVRSSWTRFAGRYDPVTTGVGSLLVTGYCVVVHGQEVGEALNIAAFATVLGMVSRAVVGPAASMHYAAAVHGNVRSVLQACSVAVLH
jgi:hypothetical protein